MCCQSQFLSLSIWRRTEKCLSHFCKLMRLAHELYETFRVLHVCTWNNKIFFNYGTQFLPFRALTIFRQPEPLRIDKDEAVGSGWMDSWLECTTIPLHMHGPVWPGALLYMALKPRTSSYTNSEPKCPWFCLSFLYGSIPLFFIIDCFVIQSGS